VVVAGRAITSLAVSFAVTAVVIVIGAFGYGAHVAVGELGALALRIAVGSLALSHGFLPGGTGVAWGDLAILAAWGLGGLAIALTRFRWSPAAIKT
jgi:hypothetical protein